MNEWQEIKKLTVNKYFVANAFIKYRAELHEPISNESKDQHFRLSAYYDISLTEIKQIDAREFDHIKRERILTLNAVDGTIHGTHKGLTYELTPDDLFVTKLSKVTHEQTEGDELHGYFEKIEVAFQMHRTEEKIVCIAGKKTGNSRVELDGIYHEYYCEDCSTEWKKEPSFETIPPVDTKTTKEATKDSKKPLQTPPIQRSSNGCFSALAYILLGIVVLLQIGVFIFSGQWMILLFFIAGYALIFGFTWLLSRLNRTIERFLPGFNLLNWLLSLGLLILLLSGLNTLFNHTNWNWNTEQKSSLDDNDIHETNYVPEPTQTYDPITDTKPDSLKEKVTIKLKWKSLDNVYYQGSYYLYKEDIQKSTANLFTQEALQLTNYGQLYSRIYSNDRYHLEDVYRMLDSIKVKNNQSSLQFANTIVSMVQSIKYVLILPNGCDNAGISSNISGINFIPECEGNRPYGLKTPLEFLADLKGDCDSRTLLLYTLLKHYDYDVAIINSEYYLHSMLGLSLPSKQINGSFKFLDGQKYYYWETTDKGFRLGELPAEISNLNYWKIVIN